VSLDGTRCHAGRMPSISVRSARCPLSNACYVVTTVTTHQFPLFHHHGNAQDVARWLRASDAERRTESFAWAIMPDRVHWLFRLRRHPMTSVVRWLKSRSAHALTQRNANQGRIWQPGCHDHSRCDERDLLARATDILSLPMRAGLASGLHGYPFSWCRWPV
jgi:REP element-mobilizing transposase RayT